MGVLSKLAHAVMPKTMTGFLLCILPIAAAVIVVAYPRALMKLFASEDPDSLLEELTSTTSGKSKKRNAKAKTLKQQSAGEKKEKQAEATAAVEDTPVQVLESSASEEEDSVTEEEQLQQMVNMHSKKEKASFGTKNVVTSNNKVTLASPIVQEIEGDWTRVPTKEEEALSVMKNRLQNITKQLEECELEKESFKSSLDKEQKRAAEAERELKDRTRSYQIRWVEMETEISGLKSSRSDLLTTIKNLEAVQDNSALMEEFAAKVASLTGERISLEETVRAVELAKLALEQEVQLLKAQNQEQKQLQETENEIQKSFKKDMEGLYGEILGLRRQIESHVELEREYQNEVSQLKVALSTASERSKSTVADMADKIMAVSMELEGAKKEIFEKSEQIIKLTDEIKSTAEEGSSALIVLKETTEKLNLELSTSQGKVQEMEVQIQNLVEEKSCLESQLSTLSTNATAQSEADKKKAVDTTELETRLAESEAKIAMLEPKIAEFESKAGELLAQISASEGKTREAEEQVVELTNKLTLQEQNNSEELSTKLVSTESRLSEVQALLERAEKKINVINIVSEAKYASFKKEIEELKAAAAVEGSSL